MADIRMLRSSGTTPPVGAGLYPGQMAVTENRLYIGLYNSTDEIASPYGVAMLNFENSFFDKISISKSSIEAFKVIDSGGTAHQFKVDTSNGQVVLSDIANVKSLWLKDTGVIESDATGSAVGTATNPFKEGRFDKVYLSTAIDGSSASNQAVTKSYVDALMNANDAMQFKGTLGTGGTVTSLPSSGYSAGWTYRVITAGSYAGQVCEVGDIIMCVKDYVSGFLNSDWSVQQTNIDGAVVGPAAATDRGLAIYNGTTGKLIQSFSGLYLEAGTNKLVNTYGFKGNVEGNVIGNVTGDVTGNLTGSASAATSIKNDAVTTGVFYVLGASSQGAQNTSKTKSTIYFDASNGKFYATQLEGLIDCGTWS